MLLTVVKEVGDVQLRGRNDVRKHFILVSKPWHLNDQTGWHLGERVQVDNRKKKDEKVIVCPPECGDFTIPLQT